MSKRIKLCLNLMRESLEGNKTELVKVSRSLSTDKVVVVVVVVVEVVVFVDVIVVVVVASAAVDEVVVVVGALVVGEVPTAKISSGSMD